MASVTYEHVFKRWGDVVAVNDLNIKMPVVVRLAGVRDEPIVRSLAAFCIGPVTASVARRAGMQVAAVADVHTAAGLATTIAEHYDREIA
mgnify:CR=1 FL=1